MTRRIEILPVAAESWRRGLQAMGAVYPWLLLFALAGGIYAAGLYSDYGLWLPLAGAIASFAAGVELSRRIYAALGHGAAGAYMPLAHANLAVYVAFLFMGFFVGFFLLILPGILIEAAGQYAIDKDSPPEQVQEAFVAMLGTAYGAAYLAVAAVGAAFLGWSALRLTVFGAATAARGEAMVFRTWRWTRGNVLALGVVSSFTHVMPFLAGLAANFALQAALPDTLTGHFLAGMAGILLFAPFLLAGHGLAAAAFERLRPEESAPIDEADGSS
ncbi:hypothetical protein [Hyphomonas sp.]|uniref:hypothetical protein n=1 Tax=Hyphomonas sp. TaxID=87 RepID=UPI00391ACA62